MNNWKRPKIRQMLMQTIKKLLNVITYFFLSNPGRSVLEYFSMMTCNTQCMMGTNKYSLPKMNLFILKRSKKKL